MPTQKALVLTDKKGKFVVQDIEIHKPGPGKLLVQVISSGLNPIDWKVAVHGHPLFQDYPYIFGCDSAGVVQEIGEGVTDFKAGDHVMHQVFLTRRQGAYQQYVISPSRFTSKIPPSLSFDQAATLPSYSAIGTAALGLAAQKLAYPNRGGAELSPCWEPSGRGAYAGQPIVVIGGASAVGQSVLQCARLSGFFPIITTASLHNEAFLKSLGATHIIDRKLPLRQYVQAITTGPIKLVYDAISEGDTQPEAYDLVAPGGTFIFVQELKIDETKLSSDKEVVSVAGSYFLSPQPALGESLAKALPALLESGDLKVCPVGYSMLTDCVAK